MILFTLSISLFDSLSTTQQIVVFVLLLTTVRPLSNALWYLAGLSGGYFACGVAGYRAIDQLRDFLAKFFPSMSNLPGGVYYQSEFFAGIIMAVIGYWYFKKKRRAGPSRTQNMVLRRLKSMNGFFAFFIGAFISISSFPVSLPYIAALGKYAMAHMSISSATIFILLYNIGYALPMIAILIVYLFARRNAEDLTGTLHEKARVLNVQLVTWAFAGVGIFSMIDAGCFFLFGHALVKGRYF